MSTEREQFEAWANTYPALEDDHGYVNLRYLGLHKQYVDFDVQRAWVAYQAGHASAQPSAQAPQPSQAAEREAMAEECKRLMGQAIYETRQAGFCPSRDERASIQAATDRALAAIDKLASSPVSSGPDALQHAREHSSGRWMPIETAPKDGTSILGYWMGGQHDCAIHATKFFKGRWWEPNEDFPQSTPSHWMPLPAPPTSGQQGRVQAAEASWSGEQDQGEDVKEGKR